MIALISADTCWLFLFAAELVWFAAYTLLLVLLVGSLITLPANTIFSACILNPSGDLSNQLVLIIISSVDCTCGVPLLIFRKLGAYGYSIILRLVLFNIVDHSLPSERIQDSLWNNISAWLDQIELRNWLNQLLLFAWPPVRGVCPNHEVMMFQPRTMSLRT